MKTPEFFQKFLVFLRKSQVMKQIYIFKNIIQIRTVSKEKYRKRPFVYQI